jgi:hypothetical protein
MGNLCQNVTKGARVLYLSFRLRSSIIFLYKKGKEVVSKYPRYLKNLKNPEPYSKTKLSTHHLYVNYMLLFLVDVLILDTHKRLRPP